MVGVEDGKNMAIVLGGVQASGSNQVGNMRLQVLVLIIVCPLKLWLWY